MSTDQNPFEGLSHSPHEPYKVPPGQVPKAADIPANKAQAAKDKAAADLANANAEAAKLLAELDSNSPSATHKMPPPNAPGETPRDPVKSLKSLLSPGPDALEESFKPAFNGSTLASSHTVDFAEKIKRANRHG